MAAFPVRLAVEKVIFLRLECYGLICSNVLPLEGREHFSKKVTQYQKKEARGRLKSASWALRGEKCTGVGRE